MPQPTDFVNAGPAMTAAAAAGGGTDRKKLVVIFLPGGADVHNTLIPRTGANRTNYDAARPSVGIADNPATALDADWCLHPALTGFKTLWDAGKLAVIRNIGPLAEPITKAQYLAATVPVPPQLYSHNNQQHLWFTGDATNPALATGWMGRLSELLIPFNTGSSITPLLSMDGQNHSLRGFDLQPIGMTAAGLPSRTPFSAVPTEVRDAINGRFSTLVGETALDREFLAIHNRSIAATTLVTNAINATADQTNIPNTTGFGAQMRTVIRLANSQASINQRRTMFYMIGPGVYDNHDNLLTGLNASYTSLNAVAIEAYNSTVTLGIDDETTFVVMTEFGRSLRQNGSGTDHGWGGAAFVFGGSVVGGWYGTPYSLDFAGPDLAFTQGHMIPTTPTETLVTTLSKWMGTPDALSGGVNPVELVSPNLTAFPVRSMSFL